MKKCINQSTIMQCTTEEFIEVCAKVGFNYIELREPKIKEVLLYKSFKEVINLLNEYGLKIASLNSFENFSLIPNENSGLFYKQAEWFIELCKLIECDILIAVPSKKIENIPFNKIKEKTINSLKELSKITKNYDIRIAFEPIGFPEYSIQKLKDAIEIIKKIDDENVGLTIDTAHFYLSGSTLNEVDNIPINKIFMVHISDLPNLPFNEIRDEHRVLPGEGILNLNLFLKKLKEKEYKEYVSIELFNKNLWNMDPKEVAEKTMRSINKVLTSL